MNVATIQVYGLIGFYDWMADRLLDDNWFGNELEALPMDVDKLEVRIDTYGGFTSVGLSMYNRLRSFAKKRRVMNPNFTTETHNDGYAYSAGSILLLGGDKRIMHRGSMLMIHNAWQGAEGDHNEMRKTADYLEKLSANLAALYVTETKSKLKLDDTIAMMNETTFFTAEEAKSAGFIDETDDTEVKRDENRAKTYKDLDPRPQSSHKYISCLMHRAHDLEQFAKRRDQSRHPTSPQKNPAAVALAGELTSLLATA